MNQVIRTPRRPTARLIKAAALRLFASRGYGGVSIRDIADEVGIQPGAIYNHFTSKQELLADLMTGHMDACLSALQAAMPHDKGPADMLRAFARFHVSYHIDQPDEVFIAYMELRSLEPESKRKLDALRDAYETVLRDILEEGGSTGALIVADPAIHARALIAMMTGVTVWYRQDGQMSRSDVVDHYVKIVMQTVGRGDQTCSITV